MQVYGQLQNAAIEVLASDPTTTVQGRVWFNTTTNKVMVDDGTTKRALERNDQFTITGNSATAAQNIRFNRSGPALIQLTTGDDVTAEGSLSMSLAQLSARVENYTYASKPANGNAGRMIYATDLASLLVDTGSTWNTIGGGGGGGGATLSWLEAAQAATPDIDAANTRVFYFTQGLTQSLFSMVKVPASYVVGKQITMKVNFYSPDSSGTALFTATATLIRPGTDLATSTTNQRVSTNTAVTLSSATANISQSVTLDITSASGQINGVAVGAGHYIVVQLTRSNSDTGVSDLVFQPFLTEVAFS